MVSKSDTTLLRTIADVIGFIIIGLGMIAVSIMKSLIPDSLRELKKLEGEIALITGGGGGLGRLMALRLVNLKVTVILWDINLDAVNETVKLVEAAGGKAYGFKCDLCNKEDVYKVAEMTKNTVGDVTILINNAGVVSGKHLLDTPDELIQRTFDVNILAHFWTVKAFLPNMMKNNKGHIVTIASMAGFVGMPKLIDYCSSKYAAVGFDESLRLELESLGYTGVKTTVICPYFIQATGMFDRVESRFFPRLKSADVADRVVEGLRREETVVTLPGFFGPTMGAKAIMPWSVLSMFLRNLVPDAHPDIPPPSLQVPVKKQMNNNDIASKITNNLHHRSSETKCA